VVVDKRAETSRAVLLGLEAAIRAQGGAAVGAEIPASLFFVTIVAALQKVDRTNVEEVRTRSACLQCVVRPLLD
jgi:hypothetical protein